MPHAERRQRSSAAEPLTSLLHEVPRETSFTMKGFTGMSKNTALFVALEAVERRKERRRDSMAAEETGNPATAPVALGLVRERKKKVKEKKKISFGSWGDRKDRKKIALPVSERLVVLGVVGSRVLQRVRRDSVLGKGSSRGGRYRPDSKRPFRDIENSISYDCERGRNSD